MYISVAQKIVCRGEGEGEGKRERFRPSELSSPKHKLGSEASNIA